MSFRSLLKRSLPRPARHTIRRVSNYVERVTIWRTILREVKGAGPHDRAILRRSALASPFTGRSNLLAWQDPVLLDDATVSVAGLGIFEIRARTDELFIILPSREPAVFSALDRCLSTGGIFVDAGANIGAFSVCAARKVGASGKVLAIEMMPETAARLRRHLVLNGVDNAEIVEAALSESAGDNVAATIQPGHAGRATLTPTLAAGLETARRLIVPTTTLADLLSPYHHISLMKMDIEGAELAALRGAGAALSKIRAIVFEQLEQGGDVAEFLSANGFRIEQLDHHNFLAINTLGMD